MQSVNVLKKSVQDQTTSRFAVAIASSEQEIRECQRLRYDVFAGEMKAQLTTPLAGHDIDHFDDYCEHLYVRDLESKQVIATTRILTNKTAENAGSYYSETEFDLRNIISAPARYMEVGRTCVHPRFRRGVGLHYLWQGVANMMVFTNTQYLFGCVSIPNHDGGTYISNIMRHVRRNHFAPGYLRVTPRVTVPMPFAQEPMQVVMPPLLRTYLNMGAMACGEPCLDKEFNVADIFILVDRQHMNKSYGRHFMRDE